MARVRYLSEVVTAFTHFRTINVYKLVFQIVTGQQA